MERERGTQRKRDREGDRETETERETKKKKERETLINYQLYLFKGQIRKSGVVRAK